MNRILVIGATSAIAEATERLLAARGDALYLVARNEQMLAAIAADLTVRGYPRVATESLDANDLSAHEAMLERAERFLGGIDIGLIAYGTLPDQKRCEASVELTVRELQTNAISVVALLTRLANRMAQRREGIIAAIEDSTVEHYLPDLKAVVGFHSGLATARPQDAGNITGKVLVCIGADDPIIPPEQRAAFETEMKAAGIDWRLQLYGGAGHSFTNPAADSRGMKGFFYHEATDRRSWNAMIELFNETLK